MARRDHSLDEKIISAAREAFLEKGYAGASLRKIAEQAGVTVGAIQTRYKSKDELFAELLRPFLEEISALFQSTRADYYAGTEADFLPQLKIAMGNESTAILRLIFEHYEDAVLLLCRSTGSKLEHCFDEIVQRKIAETVSFFHNVGGISVDEKLLGLLIAAQFDSYRRIVLECPDRRDAEKNMDALMTYHFGGWSALFDSVNANQELIIPSVCEI